MSDRNVATKTAEQIVCEIAAKHADAVAAAFETIVRDHLCGMEQSPIQKVMAAALLYHLKTDGDFTRYYPPNNELIYQFIGSDHEATFETYMPIHDWPGAAARFTTGIRITPEVSIGKYRADFFVEVALDGKWVFGVIECDGHDYHERTKEQAKHDKERDRFFQSKGLIVLRYTGSEIWKDPLNVAHEALTILSGLAKAKTAVNG